MSASQSASTFTRSPVSQEEIFFENKLFLPKNNTLVKNSQLKRKTNRLVFKRVKVHEIGLKKILNLNSNFTIITIVFHKAKQSYILMVYVPFSRRKFMLKIEFESCLDQLPFQNVLFQSPQDQLSYSKFYSQYFYFNKHSLLKKKLHTKRRRNFSQMIQPGDLLRGQSRKKHSHLVVSKEGPSDLQLSNQGADFEAEPDALPEDLKMLKNYKKKQLNNKNREHLTEFMFRFSFAVNKSYKTDLKEFDQFYNDLSLESQINYFNKLEKIKSRPD